MNTKKNGTKKERRKEEQAKALIKKAKCTNCYFYLMFGKCDDGGNCYFKHPNEVAMVNYGCIVKWIDPGDKQPFGFIKSDLTDERWYFQRCNICKEVNQDLIAYGVCVRVDSLVAESGPCRRAIDVSPIQDNT